MSLRPLLVALLLAPLALAGCVGGADDAVDAAASEPGSSSAAPAPQSPEGAPDEAVEKGEEDQGNEDGAAGAAPPVEIPISFEGKLETSASLCSENPSSITCYGVVYGEMVDEHVFEAAGTARSLTVTLSWEALTPLMEELTLTFDTSGAPDHTVLATATGPSPLTITLEEPFLLEAGAEHVISVRRPTLGEGPGPVLMFSMDQPFRLDGLLVLEPAA